jgi:hypothetical protein
VKTIPFVHPGTVTRNESLGTFFSCAASETLNTSAVAAIAIVNFMITVRDHCRSIPD